MVSPIEQIRSYLRERKHTPNPTTIPEIRASYESMAQQFPLVADTEVTRAVVNGVNGEWIAAPAADKSRVVLYLHGGCYVLGSCVTHRALASRISAASGFLVLLLDYRLAPEHPFPAAIEDACAAYRGLISKGYQPGKVAFAGDSAGGGLTLATLLTLQKAADPMPAAIALISPWTDLAGTGASLTALQDTDPWLERSELMEMAAIYLSGADSRDPLASPLYADLRGLPPMLIQVGSDEILLDDATRLAKVAEEAGVSVELDVWQGMWHVWHIFAHRLPEGQQAIEQMARFFHRKINP